MRLLLLCTPWLIDGTMRYPHAKYFAGERGGGVVVDSAFVSERDWLLLQLEILPAIEASGLFWTSNGGFGARVPTSPEAQPTIATSFFRLRNSSSTSHHPQESSPLASQVFQASEADPCKLLQVRYQDKPKSLAVQALSPPHCKRVRRLRCGTIAIGS